MPAVIGPTPDTRGMSRTWAAAECEEAFWRDHFNELLELHRDHFVAVYDGKVVAAASDLGEVVNVLQVKGITPRDAWIRYISRDARNMLL